MTCTLQPGASFRFSESLDVLTRISKTLRSRETGEVNDSYRIYPEHVLAYQDQDVLMENLDMRDSMNELKRDRGGQFATKKFDDEFS